MNKTKIYTKVDKKFSDKVVEKIKGAASIVITSHKSPDHDSISSVLAMYSYVVDYLKVDTRKVRMIYTSGKEDRWERFKHFEKIEFVEDVLSYLKNVDLLIILDGSGWNRISHKIEKGGSYDFSGEVICIDHHPTPDNIFNLHLVAPGYSATAEILYWLFYQNVHLTREICEMLLMGILGDTGNFRFVTPDRVRVFDAAKRLVAEGNIKVEELQARFERLPLEVCKLVGLLLTNLTAHQLNGWPDFVTSHVSREFVKKNKYDDETIGAASDLFAQYLKSVKGIGWGFVVTPRLAGTRISGRSIPNSVSFRDIMERMKIGGGHDRAAGGKIDTPEPEDAIKQIVTWMKENKPLIN